jgi:type IV pilus assembly protein PilM
MTSFFEKYPVNFNFLQLNKKRNAVIGIDITSSAVKLVELSKNNTGYTLESCSVVPFPRNEQNLQLPANTYVIGQTIQKALHESNTKARQAVIAVGGASVITKNISIPAGLNDDEIIEQIIIDAAKYIPYNINDVFWDFEIQGINKTNASLLDVLLVATRKELIEHKIELLKHAQLKPKVIEIETFAIGNALSLLASQLPWNIEDKTIAVVDIGANLTTLHVIHNFRSIFTRELAFGGRHLTNLIAQTYELSQTDAEQVKKKGELPEGYLYNIFEPFKQTIVQQIQRSIQFFSASQNHHQIDSIILSGGCASISSIDTLVSDALNLPTYIANPFIDMSYSSNINLTNLSENASSLLVACGLALRNFD